MSSDFKPLIGITCGLTHNRARSEVCQLGKAYPDAIVLAGGIPVIIPTGITPTALKVLFQRLDGVLLSGGGDIDPARFGGELHPKIADIDLERDQLEFSLVRLSLKADKPLLAICRGLQVLNAACGGTLYTHIADQKEPQIKHDWYPDHPRNRLSHSVSLVCGSQLDEIYGEDEIMVNSLHHQGVFLVGAGLKGTAFAPDGLVEGLEVEGVKFGIGVQWHPECLPDDPGTQALFQAFVLAASPTEHEA